MQPGPRHQNTRELPQHPPGGGLPTAQSRTRVKVYSHDFCCSEQGRRLRLCRGRSDFPRADLWDLEKLPQGTLGSFASLCFSGLSQTSLQLESPVVVLKTSGKSAPPGQQSHHTLFLLNGSCPAAKMPALGWEQPPSRIIDQQSLGTRCAKPGRKTIVTPHTSSSGALLRYLLSAGGEGCPGQTTHHAAPASPTEHRRDPQLAGNTSSATLEVSA